MLNEIRRKPVLVKTSARVRQGRGGEGLVPASCQFTELYGDEPSPPLLAHFL